VDTFFVTFRDLVPRRAVPRTGMINESGFDGICYDDKAVFWHSGSLHERNPTEQSRWSGGKMQNQQGGRNGD
jgi:hypothetical protein